MRRAAKMRLALAGASGSGKTYSSLLIAYGMTGDWSRVAVIDSENCSADLYAHLGGLMGITRRAEGGARCSLCDVGIDARHVGMSRCRGVYARGDARMGCGRRLAGDVPRLGRAGRAVLLADGQRALAVEISAKECLTIARSGE